MKIVINGCFGGFSLSDEAHEWLIKNRNWKTTGCDEKGNKLNENAQLTFTDKPEFYGKYWDGFSRENRTHQDIIDVVTILGKKASGKYADLKIIEIPDDIEYEIDEYDGIESIHEKHRKWE